MLRLIFAFVDIMLHRRGPDSLPSAPFLLWSLLALSIVADWLILWVAGAPGRVFAMRLGAVVTAPGATPESSRTVDGPGNASYVERSTNRTIREST